MHLRQLASGDQQALIAFHDRCSAETHYERFFAAKPILTPNEAAYLCDVDGAERGAIVAADSESDAIHGVGRWDAVDNHRAELALVIEDDHQAQGLGTKLLRATIRAAREAGYTRLVGEVLTANRRMRHLLARTDYPLMITPNAGGTLSFVLDIAATKRQRARRELGRADTELRERGSWWADHRTNRTPYSTAPELPAPVADRDLVM